MKFADNVPALRGAAKHLGRARRMSTDPKQMDAAQTEATIALLCDCVADLIEAERARVSSLMAGEGEEKGAPATGHPIHPPSYDEGWNAAFDEIMSMTGLPTGQEHKDRTAAEVETLLAAFGRRITALRKEPS